MEKVAGGVDGAECGQDAEAEDGRADGPQVGQGAVLQGGIFAGVKAAVDRTGAAATLRLSRTWPG
ncbi:hypothetical protein AB0E04_32150 [Streptomyces sp. NPDC048251]|uniref:hypothetical protein n=1 Tax=Streptomyces sp. NPDC048251 TaxID=3154501 RepID=UPI003417DD1B